ncbi:MAG: hypothetical protein LBR11_00735 [Deltaproteobacteria bacterium]|nr:hypothetical protein [Deltaproteobacteria bacterium]
MSFIQARDPEVSLTAHPDPAPWGRNEFYSGEGAGGELGGPHRPGPWA